MTVLDCDGKALVVGKRLDNSEEAVRSFIGELDQETKVVLEAGGNWYWMCDLLDEMGVNGKDNRAVRRYHVGASRMC